MVDDGDPEDGEIPSLAAGAVIADKYRIERLIGRGGMGSVWSAVHVSLGQRVAVKLIAKRYASSREARHRFDLEAKAVAQLRSRYVVQVYDHGEMQDGTPYIVMEYLEGESLDARISRGPLTLAAASVILEQIGRALGRAHALGMVHRDLKPENVFLTVSPDGDGEVAKVLDFGIVKLRGQEGIGSSTRTGAVLGTPLYMSPEQARGLKSVDHRTDLYSLGMVTYAMLTGQPAFTGESLGDLLVAICTQPLPVLRQTAHWLPPPMDGWFQRACAREPAERFSAAEELTTAFAVAAGLRPGAPSTLGSEVSHAGTVASPAAPSAFQPAPTGGVTFGSAAVPGTTAPTQHTAAPFSVTEHGIPKRSLAVPVALVAGAIALGGAFIATRLGRSPSPEPAAAAAPVASAVPTAAPAASAPEPAVQAKPTVTAAPSVAVAPAKIEKPLAGKPLPSASVHAAPAKTSAAHAPAGAKPSAASPPAAAKPAATAEPHPPPAKPPAAGHVDLGF
jgi:serine/threonine protein kinase